MVAMANLVVWAMGGGGGGTLGFVFIIIIFYFFFVLYDFLDYFNMLYILF